MSKNEKSQGVWNGKEQAPQTNAPIDHPPEGETQTNDGKIPKKLPESPSIAPHAVTKTKETQNLPTKCKLQREQTSKPKRKGEEGRWNKFTKIT